MLNPNQQRPQQILPQQQPKPGGATSTNTLDRVPPDTQIISVIDGSGKPVQNGGITSSNSITFTARGVDNTGEAVSTFLCSLDNRLFASCGSQTYLPNLSVGGHSFAVVAIDSAGNKDQSPAGFTWTVTQSSLLSQQSPAVIQQSPAAAVNNQSSPQQQTQLHATKPPSKLSPSLNALSTPSSCPADYCVTSGDTLGPINVVQCTADDPEIIVECEMISGPGTFSTTDGNPAEGTLTWTNAGPPGTYQASFQAVCISAPCLPSNIFTITIYVNAPPVAVASADKTEVNSGDVVTLDASQSYDPDNNLPLTYSWIQVNLGFSSTDEQATFTAPSVTTDTTYFIFLEVRDALGGFSSTSSFAEVGILVHPVNHPPVANAGPDQTVTSGDTVTLQGSGTDADNDPLKYSWTQTAGPSVTLSDASSPAPTFTAPEVDTETTLTFQLIVNDGKINSEPASVNVIVNPECGCSSTPQTLESSSGTITADTASSCGGKNDPTYIPAQGAQQQQYLVKASSLLEVYNNYHNQYPPAGYSLTEGNVQKTSKLAHDPKTGFVNCKTHVDVQIIMHLPNFPGIKNKKLFSPAAQAEWNRFLGALTVHENGHVSIIHDGTAYGVKYGGGFDGIVSVMVGQDDTGAINTLDQRGTDTQNAHDAYDAATHHGELQGAVLCYNPPYKYLGGDKCQ